MGNKILGILLANARTRDSRSVNRRGATAIEVSLVAPVFFLAIFGAIELSRVAMLRNLAQDASYEAARICIVDGATETEAIDAANSVLALLATQGAEITINDGAGINQQSPVVEVDIEIPLNQNSFVLPWLFAGQSIRASSLLKTDRYSGYFEH